jgi:hypothetical protein
MVGRSEEAMMWFSSSIGRTFLLLNVMKWVTFLPYIWKLAGSDLGPETCRPDYGFLWFSSDHPGKYRVVPHIRP